MATPTISIRRGLVKAALYICAFLLSFGVHAAAHASFSATDFGANITPSSPTDLDSASFKNALQQLKTDNATGVSIVIPLLQTTSTSSDIHTNPYQTPSDESLVRAIQYAHALGLKVTLKPHLDPQDGQWRAFINPTNRSVWFANYDAMLMQYAALAQANHVENFIIGTELINVSSNSVNANNTDNWRALISHVRSRYSGTLGYAANWGPQNTLYDEKNNIGFWDLLDFAGVDAYYPLGTSTLETSVSAFANYWPMVDQTDITAFAASVHKPIYFTEIGYKSTNGAHLDPGDYTVDHGPSQDEQANAYEAFFAYWNKSATPIAGVYLWEWSSNPINADNDINYFPQNKEAETVITRWFSGHGTSVPYSLHALSFSVDSNATMTLGAASNIVTLVSNSGRQEKNLLVDVEIYDASGTKVFQKFFDSQNISVGETKKYTLDWTPSAVGTYTVRGGVFGANWSPNYVWNNSASTVTVTVSAPVAPISTASFAVAFTTPGQIFANQPLYFSAAVTSASQAQALIDVEIYDANNQKKFQQFFSAQSFTANETKRYSLSFTPTDTGTYRIATGVFSNDWSRNYLWQNQPATMIVASIPAPAPVVPVATPVPTPTPVPVPTPPIATTTPATSTPVVVPPAATSTQATTTPSTPIPTPATTTPSVPVTPAPATTTPVVPAPATAIAFPTVGISKQHNGNVTLMSVDKPSVILTRTQTTRITAALMSQGGDNANNVIVQMALIQNGAIIFESKTTTDILHDGQRVVSLEVPTTLSAGSYSLAVVVYNNADGLVNAQFLNAGSVQVNP